MARALLEARVAACVNILPAIESQYWWKGRIEESAEALLIVKTTAGAFERLREVVAARHPYECPEVLAVAAAEGGPAYLRWVRSEVGGCGGSAAP